MANLGKIMKQAQEMQRQMEAVQAELNETVLEESSGGGAVKVTITGHSELQSLTIDPDFLKEDAETVQATILQAFQAATEKAKALQQEKMGSVTQGMGGLPGLGM